MGRFVCKEDLPAPSRDHFYIPAPLKSNYLARDSRQQYGISTCSTKETDWDMSDHLHLHTFEKSPAFWAEIPPALQIAASSSDSMV